MKPGVLVPVCVLCYHISKIYYKQVFFHVIVKCTSGPQATGVIWVNIGRWVFPFFFFPQMWHTQYNLTLLQGSSCQSLGCRNNKGRCCCVLSVILFESTANAVPTKVRNRMACRRAHIKPTRRRDIEHAWDTRSTWAHGSMSPRVSLTPAAHREPLTQVFGDDRTRLWNVICIPDCVKESTLHCVK